MSAPLVSVILPTHRRGRVIARALQSVLTQSYRNIEVIVVDDASGDDTEQVVRGFNDARVRYVAHPDRRCVAAARNHGLSLASGQYVAFQGSDDEWLADKLAHQVARMESLPADVALTQGAIMRFHVEGAHLPYYVSGLPNEAATQDDVQLPGAAIAQAWLVRKSALDEIGNFDERLPIWEDWDLMLRLCGKWKLDIDGKAVAIVYEKPDEVAGQDDVRAAAFRLIADKHRDLMHRYPLAMAENLYSFAKLEIIVRGQAASGRMAAAESLRLNPRQSRGWILLLTSLGGTLLPRLIARTAHRVRGWGWELRRRWSGEEMAA